MADERETGREGLEPVEPGEAPVGRGPQRGPFIPNRDRRRAFESVTVRLVATAGIIGIGTAVGAIMGTQDVDAWIIGLVVSVVSVVLAAVLWSSRSL